MGFVYLEDSLEFKEHAKDILEYLFDYCELEDWLRGDLAQSDFLFLHDLFGYFDLVCQTKIDRCSIEAFKEEVSWFICDFIILVDMQTDLAIYKLYYG